MIKPEPKPRKWDEAQEGRIDGTEDPDDLNWDQYGSGDATIYALVFLFVALGIAWIVARL
jgi:hypothetical protein